MWKHLKINLSLSPIFHPNILQHFFWKYILLIPQISTVFRPWNSNILTSSISMHQSHQVHLLGLMNWELQFLGSSSNSSHTALTSISALIRKDIFCVTATVFLAIITYPIIKFKAFLKPHRLIWVKPAPTGGVVIRSFRLIFQANHVLYTNPFS